MSDPVILPWLRDQAEGRTPLVPLDLRNTQSLMREIDALTAPPAEAPSGPSASYVAELEAQLVDARAQLAAALAGESVAKATLERFEASLANLKLDVAADPQITFSGKP